MNYFNELHKSYVIYRKQTFLSVTNQEECFGFQKGDLLEGMSKLVLCINIKSNWNVLFKKVLQGSSAMTKLYDMCYLYEYAFCILCGSVMLFSEMMNKVK